MKFIDVFIDVFCSFYVRFNA